MADNKIKLTIETTHQEIQMANFLLKQAFNNAYNNTEFQKHFKVTTDDLEAAEDFRMKFIMQFLRKETN